jgi:hypothetical protein
MIELILAVAFVYFIVVPVVALVAGILIDICN